MGVLPNSKTTMDSCIELCLKCVRACEECFDACLAEPNVQERVECIKVLNDCAQICSLAVQFMARNSKFSKDLCNLCANLCEECAKGCDMFTDPHCKACAEICRQCAQECRNMAA